MLDKSLIQGLIGSAVILVGAILTLIGVIYKTRRDYLLGNRTADINDRSGLHKENAELRTEIDALWEKKRELRQQLEAKDAEIRALKERDAWHEKNRRYQDNLLFVQGWRLDRVLEAALKLGWKEPPPPQPSVSAPPPEPIPENGPDLTKQAPPKIVDVS